MVMVFLSGFVYYIVQLLQWELSFYKGIPSPEWAYSIEFMQSPEHGYLC